MATIPGTPISGLTNQTALQQADAIALYWSLSGGNAKITIQNLFANIVKEESGTISGGAYTIVSIAPVVYLTIDTEGAAAADDLDTINKQVAGQIIILEQDNNARAVTVRDSGVSGGNINTAGSVNFNLTSKRSKMILIERKGVDSWDEIARSLN
jgi:hypothetical protein